MTTPRLNIPPSQPASLAQLGYNMQTPFTDTNGLAAMKAGGATIARTQPAWVNVESYSSPGTYSLGAATEAALAYCGANGIQVDFVCAFGPPSQVQQTLTVGPAGAAFRTYTIPISAGNLSLITTPVDHLVATGNNFITGGHDYAGSLIDSVNVGAGTITLGRALNQNLTAGQSLIHNRLLYAAPATTDPNDASIVAFFNYLKYCAGRIAANGCTGWVTIWNEPPWFNSYWPARGAAYDSPPAGMNADVHMTPFLAHALALGPSDLPSGVRIINGGTDKGNGGALFSLGLGGSVTSTTIAQNITVESLHPYSNPVHASTDGTPEDYYWDRSYVNPSGSFFIYSLLNQTVDSTGNFHQLAASHGLYTQFPAGAGLGLMATETGKNVSDDTRQAIWLLRRVVSSWGCKVIPVVYAFTDGAPFNVMTKSGSTYTPRLGYTALQSLMTIISGLGGAGGSANDVPYVVGYQDRQWPLMGAGIYGASKSVLFVWQRTGAETTSAWSTIPTPATYSAQFAIPAGKTVTSVTDVLTGSAVSHTQVGSVLTVAAISESPTAIIVA